MDLNICNEDPRDFKTLFFNSAVGRVGSGRSKKSDPCPTVTLRKTLPLKSAASRIVRPTTRCLSLATHSCRRCLRVVSTYAALRCTWRCTASDRSRLHLLGLAASCSLSLVGKNGYYIEASVSEFELLPASRSEYPRLLSLAKERNAQRCVAPIECHSGLTRPHYVHSSQCPSHCVDILQGLFLIPRTVRYPSR